jgi:hypothetical protein
MKMSPMKSISACYTFILALLKGQVWDLLSTFLVMFLALTPLLIFLFDGDSHHLLVAAVFAFYFWPSTAVIIRKAVINRDLPRIVGGPRLMWPGSKR